MLMKRLSQAFCLMIALTVGSPPAEGEPAAFPLRQDGGTPETRQPAGMSPGPGTEPKKVLLVTTTTGFRHSSIPTGEKIIQKLGKESGLFTVDLCGQPPNRPSQPKPPKDADEERKARHNEEMAAYDEASAAWQTQLKKNLEMLGLESLRKFDAVIFANTTGDLPIPDRDAFLQWVKDGHGFIGIHSASDTYHGFRPYLDMLGAEFETHGAQVRVDAINQDMQCAACKHLGEKFGVFDEIYIFKNFDRSRVHGLLMLDAHPNNRKPGDYPVAWKKDFGKGRVFYTSLGHREDVWDDDTPAEFERKNSKEVALAYQQHILGGIQWALGPENRDAKPKATE